MAVIAQVGVYIRDAVLRQDPYYEKLGYNYYLIRSEHGTLKELCLSIIAQDPQSNCRAGGIRSGLQLLKLEARLRLLAGYSTGSIRQAFPRRCAFFLRARHPLHFGRLAAAHLVLLNRRFARDARASRARTRRVAFIAGTGHQRNGAEADDFDFHGNSFWVMHRIGAVQMWPYGHTVSIPRKGGKDVYGRGFFRGIGIIGCKKKRRSLDGRG